MISIRTHDIATTHQQARPVALHDKVPATDLTGWHRQIAITMGV
jgi:hypothetical protein